MGAPTLRLWLLRLLLGLFRLYEVDVAKELGKVKVLLLDVTTLKFVDIVDDTTKVRLMMGLNFGQEVGLC